MRVRLQQLILAYLSDLLRTVLVGGKVVPGTNDSVTSELTSWSAIVLPDEFLSDGKLLYFMAFFVSDTPVYLQIWRPGNASQQLTLAYYMKVFPQTLNEVQTVSIDKH